MQGSLSFRSSLTLPPTLLAARRFAARHIEYRARGFAVRPARILEQKRDCSQSTKQATDCKTHPAASADYQKHLWPLKVMTS